MKFFALICALLILMSAGYSGLFRKKFAVMMPLSVFSAILILYIAGLTAHMKVGVIAFIGISAILFLAGLTRSLIRRDMKTYAENVLSFGLVFFIGIMVLVYFMTDGRLLSRFDEFTHWGLTIKNYMIFDGFANVKGSTTHGAGYQPGISLFCYLFTSLKKQVSESDMLRGMDVFVISMLLPVFRRISWRRVVIGIFLIPFVLCAPWLFSTAIIPYNTLYIDAAMALCFAFLLYFYYSNEQKKVTYFVMGLGSAAMVLIRPGSEAFALMILIMIVIDVLIFRRPEFRILCKRRAGWILPVFYVLITAASWVSWRVFTTSHHMMQVFDYIEPSGQDAAQTGTVSANFFQAMSTVPENAVIKVSYIIWIVILAALAVVMVLLSKGARERWRMAVASILVIGGFLAYAGALLYMYIHLFSEYEGANLASLHRYMATFLLGAVIFFLFMIFEKIFARFGGFGNILVLVPIALILAFTPWSRVTKDMFDFSETVENTVTKREAYYKVEEFASGLDHKKDRVYFIAQDSNGYEYQVSYYLATPVSLSYDYEMGWSLGVPYSDEDVWTLDISAEDWEKALINGDYTYVYIYHPDHQFRSTYGELFEYPTSISSNSAFRVDVSGGHVTLKRVF